MERAKENPMPMTHSEQIAEKKPWRELYPVHPCADVFPMMPDDEIDALAEDIKAHGLRTPVVLTSRDVVLDGRNRLEALSRLGVNWSDVTFTYHEADPAAFVISANIRRRHLTKEQQAELIVRTLEAGQPNDRAKVARSFNPTNGQRGGSTKDPLLAAAVEEGQKHDISKRTIQNARAKVAGRSTIEPTVTVPPLPSTYEWVDAKNTQLHKQRAASVKAMMDVLTQYEQLTTERHFSPPEQRTARHNFETDLRHLRERVEQVFGGRRRPAPTRRQEDRGAVDEAVQ
jgi:hypothetical protein